MNNIVNRLCDKAELPCFEYTGEIPYSEKLANGSSVKLPPDPWFILGNYRFTMFTHVSGEYELISGQRTWARINQGERRNSGENSSVLKINGREFSLTGMNSLSADTSVCRRIFGCGFAEYRYNLGDVTIVKNLSVKPSATPYDGASAFLLTVKIKNNSGEKFSCGYTETVSANFNDIRFQCFPEEWCKVKYTYTAEKNSSENYVRINIKGECDDPLLCGKRSDMARYDGFPPSLFMKSLCDEISLTADERTLAADYETELAPDEEKAFSIIIGFDFNYEISTVEKICTELKNYRLNGTCSAYAEEWNKVIPDFENEQDSDLRRELRWHAYTLEAMATYSEYYGETKIPQGTIYDYDWGNHASARDNFQHALPLCYYNPTLAKSVLKYMLKRTTPFGEIRLIECGNGYADNERYFTSDQQLYYFLLLSEYLRVTKDYAFLGEKVMPYPAKNQTEMTVLELTEKCFVFLRDTIGTGEHGLVRLLNSDWNDAVYYIENVPYNNIFFTGESHMNSAMAVSILQNLIPQLEKYNGSEKLCRSMTLYRQNILDAFIRDLGEQKFPARMYFNGKRYGCDNMFLEPQGFTLQIAELSEDFKRTLFTEMQCRVYNGEKLGAREQERPEFEDEGFDKGSRENGGFWWALNGPVITGVSRFDKPKAWELLKNMTLKHLSEEFPNYWSSYWSAADNLESSLIPEEGLPDQSLTYWNIPVFCAHPHAWILYCYYYLNE